MRENRLMKMLTFPKRALAKAGEAYVRAMNSFADSGCSYGAATFGMVEPLPRSFSSSSAASRSSHADERELVRAASASRAYDKRLDLAALDRPTGATGVQRSASVGMAKIDEDKDLDGDSIGSGDRKGEGRGVAKKKGRGLFGRSKSYAVSSTAV